MIARPSEPRGSDPVVDVVRGNTVSALTSAALFLYFGFDMLAEPTGTDRFAWCNWIFFHAIRFGGFGFAVVALLSMAGLRLSLVVDGVLSIVLGAVFVPCTIGMLLGGGGMFNVVIIGALGGFMIVSGVRDMTNWRCLATPTSGAPRGAFIDPDEDTVAAASERRIVRTDNEPRTTIATIRVDETQPSSRHAATPRSDGDPGQGARSDPNPSEKASAAPPSPGYLAALGKQPPPPPT